jgi:drug/metabolite transporter (DMT)-like permease
MARHVKLIIWGVVLGLLPFVVFLGATSSTVENGEVTSYQYLNLAAIALGIAAVCVGVALMRRSPNTTAADRRPGWAVAVGVVLILLGAFQVVRGAGVLPGITDCVSESGSAGFCADLPESDPIDPDVP